MYYVNVPFPDEDPYQNKDWKLKKKIILTRDNFECQECQNEYIIKKSTVGKILKIEKYPNLLTILNRSNELFYKHPYKIDYIDDLGKKYSQNILSHLEINNFEKFTGVDIYLCTIRDKNKSGEFLKDAVNQIMTDTVITCIKNPNSNRVTDNWFYVRNLHVHHLNYPNDDNLANVADEDLITLCPRCHQKKHPHRDLAGFCD